jgi:hypothetical protein
MDGNSRLPCILARALQQPQRCGLRISSDGEADHVPWLASLRIADGKIVRFDGFSDIFQTLSNES